MATDSPPIDASLIPDVLETGQALQGDVETFRRCALASDLPVWLPPEFADNDARALAVNALCRLWYDDMEGEPVPPSGLLCADADTLTAARALNEAKARFYDAVVALRNSARLKNLRIARLVEDLANTKTAKRDADLARALRNMGFSRLSLQHCYRQLRILPAPLQTISYTWQRRHSDTTRVSLTEAIALAEELHNANTREWAIERLNALPPQTILAHRKGNTNQLRANIWYGPSPRQVEKKTVVTSSVCLVQGESLPARIRWRDLPIEPSDKMPRHDATVDPDPFIEVLHLHRYLQEPPRARRRTA